LIFEQKYMVGSGLNQNLTSAHALVWVLDEWWLWKVSLRSYVSPLPFALFSYWIVFRFHKSTRVVGSYYIPTHQMWLSIYSGP